MNTPSLNTTLHQAMGLLPALETHSHPGQEEHKPEKEIRKLLSGKVKSSRTESPNQTQEDISMKNSSWDTRSSTEVSSTTPPPRTQWGGAQLSSVELNPTTPPPQRDGGAQLSSNPEIQTTPSENKLAPGSTKTRKPPQGAQLSLNPTTKPTQPKQPWSTTPDTEAIRMGGPKPEEVKPPTPRKTKPRKPTLRKQQINTNQETNPNPTNPTLARKPNLKNKKGVPEIDNTARKPTTLHELWSKLKTKEAETQKKPTYENQKPVDQTRPENTTCNRDEPKITKLALLKPPKKTDEPKTKKPKPKTENLTKPSTQISSITQYFETVFKPNQPDENQPIETRNREPAATTINNRKPTFDLPTSRKNVRKAVAPKKDDKPTESPSTPITSQFLNLPTIPDASHPTLSRNLPIKNIPRNLPTLSSGAPELGLGSTNNSGDTMCTRTRVDSIGKIK